MTFPQQNEFAYWCYDLLTGRPLGAVPMTGVQFSSQVNTPGSFSGTIPLWDPAIQALNPAAMTLPNHTMLIVDYLGSPVWGGMITGRDWTVDRSQGPANLGWQITGSELWQYWNSPGRVQATDYSSPPYSGINPSPTPMPIWNAANNSSLGVPYAWDPMLIAAQLIYDSLLFGNRTSISYGNICGGITILLNGYPTVVGGTPNVSGYLASGPNTPSANYIGINYPFPSLQLVGTLVGQLSQLGLGVGFDVGVDVAYGPNGPMDYPSAVLNLSYPRRGRTVAQDNLSLDLTRARKYRFPEDGTTTANLVYGTGGTGAIVAQEDLYALEQGYPLFERVFNISNLNSAVVTDLLDEITYGLLWQYAYPPVAPTATVGLTDLPLNTFSVGDDVELILPPSAPDGTVWDPRFPAGLEQEWRIVQRQCTVADQGDATIDLTFNQPPVQLPTSRAI